MIYQVSEINRLARQLLEESLSTISIEGEISNLISASSGHFYFSLKDAQAQLRCALFAFQARKLKSKLENGMQVIVTGKLSIYENRGDYQCIADSVEPAGAGQLLKAFEALKAKLAKAGLFDDTKKRAIPRFPKRIGVITSPSGAAIRDILKVLRHRYPIAEIILYPSLVQGEQASEQLIARLECANARAECDVLILTRGGGAIEDLWAFNHEALAYAIANSRLPVITGIGHEIDFTIADFVADLRAATPSAAAMLATPDSLEFSRRLLHFQNRFIQLMNQFLLHAKHHIRFLKQRLPHPQHQLQSYHQRLDSLEQRLRAAIQKTLLLEEKRLAKLLFALQTLSPLATLNRGYALAFNEQGQLIQETKSLKKGEAFTLQLQDGSIQAIVK